MCANVVEVEFEPDIIFSMATFTDVPAVPNFPELEQATLDYWKKNKIFEKSIEQRPPDKQWTFLDGPPFVTGMPHYGSLLSSIAKDPYGRFWTMKGYRVRRVWGWDGHGLPIENKVENELKITRKKDIEEKVGVDVFIQECKKYVAKVSGEWEWYVDHIGRWVDFQNAYRTWDTNYMESVMWVFKQMYDKGKVYKGLRVSQYCPHCATPISNFEVAMDAENYKDVTDHATTYKYPVEGEEKTYFLAWSTTPWNKIVTPALAVNPTLEYVTIKVGDEKYILAKSTLESAIDEPYEVVRTVTGADLVGKKFVPHYNFYKHDTSFIKTPIEPDAKWFEIVADEFVTADEGTGIVTLAVYGEEDLVVMQREHIPLIQHVDEEGHIVPNVPLFGGMYYKKADKAVNADLADRGLIYKDEPYTHSVAHCWRCATPLFYNPMNAWYVDVQSMKPLLQKTNEQIHWFPAHFKHGRFAKSMENAPDWNISRNRYWGSPVPVWECECGERFVPGSIKELEQASGATITDLHKPQIDEVTVVCRRCGKTSHRTPEVLDSWIEAGSASFAERHFPFVDGLKLEDFFPPDFIAEYTGQIRAWFYVLHVIGGAIYGTQAFKNVVVTGVILGTDGRKMSKNFKNYPDPKEMLQKYGGDALRLYLIGSPVMRGEDILISEVAYRDQVRNILLMLWNTYKYFVLNANQTGFTYQEQERVELTNILDIWMRARLSRSIQIVTSALEGYDTVSVVAEYHSLIQDISTWYIRRSRERSTDSAFLTVLYECLITVSKLIAPIAPFIADEIFRNLTRKESVHLEDWPTTNHVADQDTLLLQMNAVRGYIEKAHAARKERGVAIKQPLASVEFVVTKDSVAFPRSFDELIQEELNVKSVTYTDGTEESVSFDFTLTDELKEEGEARIIIRKIQAERKTLGTARDEYVNVTIPSWPARWEEEIKRKTLTNSLANGAFSVTRIVAK